jgi:hypothetical protein
MTSFHEAWFPDNIAYGATGGPEFATTVAATGAGHERRNVNWSEALGRWDVASGLTTQVQIDELIAFFRTRRGKAYGFRFKDWTDYQATGQQLGTGDHAQTQYQLLKHYASGSVIEARTPSRWPGLSGSTRTASSSSRGGRWTSPPVWLRSPRRRRPGHVRFRARRAVRFDTDHMAVTIETCRLHRWQQIPILELTG